VKPSVFVASSVESLAVAYAAQEALEPDANITVWTQGVFDLSRYPLESLLEAIKASDFALFVFAPVDVTKMRGSRFQTVRDNVVFELGMFISSLGRERNFILVPRSMEKLQLPSDLIGVTVAMFDADRPDGNLVAGIGGACNKIRTAMQKIGAREARPRVYSFNQFAEIEKSAENEVWIVRPYYMLEVDAFFDVLAANLGRNIKYRYFVHPGFDFTGELNLLISRFHEDSRIGNNPADLISVHHLLAAEFPCTFVFIDPASKSPRGFAIFENVPRGPDYWVELSTGQVVRYIAAMTMTLA